MMVVLQLFMYKKAWGSDRPSITFKVVRSKEVVTVENKKRYDYYMIGHARERSYVPIT
jgi:hypothetical protein